MENYTHNGSQGNYIHNGSLDDSHLKFGKMYHVIDAWIDTMNTPENRKNAIKFGVRAVGELLSEFPHQQYEKQHSAESNPEDDLGKVKSDPNAPVSGSK